MLVQIVRNRDERIGARKGFLIYSKRVRRINGSGRDRVIDHHKVALLQRFQNRTDFRRQDEVGEAHAKGLHIRALTPSGRKGFFRAYELRMDTLVTHPLFEYRVSYRRLLEIQARLLARVIEGEIATYPVFVTR
jgi:hypothetical protein